MALDRGVLARIDGRVLKEISNENGTQLVKVPVSPAVWSTWRRYCEVAGLSMGGALAALLLHELESVVDKDLDDVLGLVSRLRADLARIEIELADRERELDATGERLTAWEERLKATARRQERVVLPPAVARATGRNDPCPCGSGRKYKVCHGSGSPI